MSRRRIRIGIDGDSRQSFFTIVIERVSFSSERSGILALDRQASEGNHELDRYHRTVRPLYIFDLDGTLALVDHRRHLVEGGKKRWREFYAACVDDVVNAPVVRTMHLLRDAGADVWIWSGRSDEVQAETEAWLARLLAFEIDAAVLRMREATDHRPDTRLKQSWLHSMTAEDRVRLVAVFDDRASVVAMWRENGVACFQVAPGDF